MNYETISGFEFIHPERHEQATRHSVQSLVRNLFPNTRGTGIPACVEEVVDVLEPLCEPTREVEDNIFLRGNPVPRLVLDGRPMFAPLGYWEIQRAYQKIEGNPKFVGESDLADAVVRHLSAGPDVDIMVRNKSDITDNDMFRLLQQRSEKRHAKNSGIQVAVTEAPLSAWNGEEDPRVYSQIVFSAEQHGRSRPVLRVDIGEAPDEDTFRLDGRLSLYATSFDVASMAGLRRNGGHWYAGISGKNKDILFNRPVQAIASGAQPGNKAVVGTRLMNQWLFWQRRVEPLTHFVFRQRQHWTPRASDWDLPSLPLIDSYWDAITPESLESVQRREGDIACQNILGLTIDPYAWPELARSIGYLSRTKLGTLLSDATVRTELTRTQADSTQGKMCDDFRLGVVEELSFHHRTQFLSFIKQLSFLGPLSLVRDLKRIGALGKDTPVTIASAIDLVSPTAYLRDQLQLNKTPGVVFDIDSRGV